MKKQIKKSLILSTYMLLAQELICMNLRNRKKSLITELNKRFLLDMREKTCTKFIISLLEKFTKPKMLIKMKIYYLTSLKSTNRNLQIENGKTWKIPYLLTL